MRTSYKGVIMNKVIKNLLLLSLLLMCSTAYSQQNYLFTMGTEVPSSFLKVESFDGKISTFLNSNTTATEREVIIVAPAAQGGLVPPSVERQIRELKAQAKAEGHTIEPRVLLISKDYLNNVDNLLKKYNALLSNQQNLQLDPTAKELYEQGDKIALLSYLSQNGMLDNVEQKEEVKETLGALGRLNEKLKKTILHPDPEVRRTTLITLPIKAGLQAISCYFAVYIAGDIPADRIVPFIAFNMTMTVLINAFITDFIKARSATTGLVNDLHDKGVEKLLKQTGSWKSFVDKRMTDGKPWLFDATFSRLLSTNGAIPNFLNSTTRVSKFVIKGDMAFQYFVSLFFLVAGTTITDSWTGLNADAAGFVNGVRSFIDMTPVSSTGALTLTAFILGLNFWNCLSGVPIDVVNSYFNRIGLFKNKTSIWYSFVPEVLYQKDKLAQVGLGGLNNALNWVVTIVSLPVYVIAHYVYPVTKDDKKEILNDEKIKSSGLDQIILAKRLYPHETSMLEFLDKPLPADLKEFSSPDYKQALLTECLFKISKSCDEGSTLREVVAENPDFFVRTFADALLESSEQEKIEMVESILSAANKINTVRYKGDLVRLNGKINEIKNIIVPVEEKALRENLIKYLEFVSDMNYSNVDTPLDKLVTAVWQSYVEGKDVSNLYSEAGQKSFFGTKENLGRDGLFYYFKIKSQTATDNATRTEIDFDLVILSGLALIKIDEIQKMGEVGEIFLRTLVKDDVFTKYDAVFAKNTKAETVSEIYKKVQEKLRQAGRDVRYDGKLKIK